MQKNIQYATHAKVLNEHPSLDLICGVDPDPESRNYFSAKWGISEVHESIENVEHKEEIELAVICTPPHIRKTIIDTLPGLVGLMLEKPIANTIESSVNLVQTCKARNLKLQVNLTRRSDKVLKRLADGELKEMIGDVQAAFGIYGNGLHNNGIHMIDLVRMLLGEIKSVRALNPINAYSEGPITGDRNFSFQLILNSGVEVYFQPVKFNSYRENSLDIYGRKGRIEIVHEGLDMIYTPINQCRSLSSAEELSSDQKEIIHLGYSTALYDMYDNLIKNIKNETELDCSGELALLSTQIVESIFNSFRNEGREEIIV